MPGVWCREECLVFERRDTGLVRVSSGMMKHLRCVSLLVRPHRHLIRVALRGKGSRFGGGLGQVVTIWLLLKRANCICSNTPCLLVVNLI